MWCKGALDSVQLRQKGMRFRRQSLELAEGERGTHSSPEHTRTFTFPAVRVRGGPVRHGYRTGKRLCAMSPLLYVYC